MFTVAISVESVSNDHMHPEVHFSLNAPKPVFLFLGHHCCLKCIQFEEFVTAQGYACILSSATLNLR